MKKQSSGLHSNAAHGKITHYGTLYTGLSSHIHIHPLQWNFGRQTMNKIIRDTGNFFKTETLFELIPTIDCFGTDRHCQRICSDRIKESDSFFNGKYDKPSYWKGRVAWANPPRNRKVMACCLNKFNSRKIRGYCCLPRWKMYRGLVNQAVRQSKFVITVSDNNVVLYFDHQNI